VELTRPVEDGRRFAQGSLEKLHGVIRIQRYKEPAGVPLDAAEAVGAVGGLLI
jgi:hypothetical protein